MDEPIFGGYTVIVLFLCFTGIITILSISLSSLVSPVGKKILYILYKLVWVYFLNLSLNKGLNSTTSNYLHIICYQSAVFGTNLLAVSMSRGKNRAFAVRVPQV